jgi:hypothetical protein
MRHNKKLQRIILDAGFLQGANVEAFDGVDHLGPLPGKHQLRNGPLASVIGEPLTTYQVRIGSGTSGIC